MYDDPTPAPFPAIRPLTVARLNAQIRELEAINKRASEIDAQHFAYIAEQSYLKAQYVDGAEFADPIDVYVEKIIMLSREAEQLHGIAARKANGLREAGVL